MTQIFIEPELELLHEESAEWEQIVNELGLTEQIKKTGASEGGANPYMKMDPKTERVFTILCPAKVDLHKYSASTIPVDVLKEIKRCTDNQWFAKLEVWYDDKSPDPLIVGYDSKEWGANKFLVARWGDEILPFESLERKAVDRMKLPYRKSIEKLILDLQARLTDVEGEVQAFVDLGGNEWGSGWKLPKYDSPFRS